MATDTQMTKQEPQKLSASERFTNLVIKEYNQTGKYEPTDHEKQLIRNYFIAIDQTLAKAEAERLRKNENNSDPRYNNDLPYDWNHLNLPQLAQDLAHYARVGLDMMQDNTLFPIPFKDNKAQKYTMNLMEGYNGIKMQAVKYALEPFKAVTVEVVYENDQFRPIKKDSRCPIESYEFEIVNPFDRGKPVGVFGYIEYEDPAKNRLVVFSEKDVMKRKPKYASPEFWGGEKTVYEKGKATKTTLEGWLPEMFEKTMKREIYGSKQMPRDPAKIDESYEYIRRREQQFADAVIEAEIVENANREPLEIPGFEEQQETPDAPEALNPPAPEQPDADSFTPEAGF